MFIGIFLDPLTVLLRGRLALGVTLGVRGRSGGRVRGGSREEWGGVGVGVGVKMSTLEDFSTC